ncbi:DNase I-like protein [Irpex rosettiformis]|uniref:DNase I-like protein n=1 Tax=Irpex rosettiformis TaxID=378272 RepID=A0ACB8UEX9_9APHY|nr:DNase I-like protein [Irpex rosettiformis]
MDAPPSSAPPSIAVSPQTDSPVTISPPLATTPSVLPERKTFGAHPPPPTRTIALGDKLPPARRQPSGSSSDEEEEEVIKKVELLPDSSRASRRPPDLKVHSYSESYIHVPAYTGVMAVAGSIVAVASGHHLKIYDLSQSDSPVHDLDSRGIGLEAKTKDFKVTSMEFRPAAREADRGCYLWIGTKDGHLFELDVHAGLVVGMKLAIHTHAVTHMCRYGNNMVTLDETGKALVFTPDIAGADPGLSATQARVVRIADKQEFAKIIDGKLWTSARDPNGTSAGNTSRGPIIRVYDIFVPGSTGRSVLPTEHLGAVTSGTVLQSQPGQVFIGHEGGNVSLWSLDTEDGLPVCQEVIKVSTSDILCLEGVNNRLWAGGRKGNISAYDVSHRPWVMTNHWQAHRKLPVLRLVADTWSIEKYGRLGVYSAGRDEKIRFWDGLLGMDWIDQELLKREAEYSSFRDLTVLVISWNMDSARPDVLIGSPENINFLHNALTSVDAPDIISFGFQELIDLESRKMAAKSVLLGGKSRTTDGAISQRVTTAYKKWYDRLISAVRLAMPPDTPYTVIHTENLVGLFSCIFVKDTQVNNLRDTALTTIKRGMGGRYGNKGGIIARMVIDDSSICFINCHLAAGQHHVRQRNADVAAFLEEELFPESREPAPYVNGGDGTLVLDHEIVFLSGDMNYRIDLRRDAVVTDIQKGDFSRMIAQDQLLKEMKNNRAFRLRPFIEGPLTFAPTYKYDRRSDEYDSSEKRRVPAWCDRVLWRSRESTRVKQLHYRRYEANVSDHRPISSAFNMTVKSISPERREPVKAEVAALWTQKEVTLLEAAYQFYASQNLV